MWIRGAIYRTVVSAGPGGGADPSNPAQVESLLRGWTSGWTTGEDGVQRMYLSGRDVTGGHPGECGLGPGLPGGGPPSRCGTSAGLPAAAGQRAGRGHGRPGHRGTVVLPRARVKIFLTAAPEAGQSAACWSWRQRGQDAALDTVLSDIIRRDEQDRNRADCTPSAKRRMPCCWTPTRLDRAGSLEALLASCERGCPSEYEDSCTTLCTASSGRSSAWPTQSAPRGGENIPEGARYLCANHSALCDPILVCFACTLRWMVRPMAKIELSQVPVLGWLLGKATRDLCGPGPRGCARGEGRPSSG